MAANGNTPLEIGTRGTVGSLVKKEIEYFREFEVERVESSRTSSERSFDEIASRGGRRKSWPTSFFRFSLKAFWRRKKIRNSGVCSVVDVNHHEMNEDEIPGFRYQNLRAHSFREI
ncbi:hypothetical protein ABFS82_13G129300 [Erythranthe guttata]|nr:PREDICTED: uncharacterized protein LOC105968327 [Erythranthe guttata]|eukprot:XP_012848411.1 PREDICTED: uncharacterized protein LOC105968327 [Erythranthe guttata]